MCYFSPLPWCLVLFLFVASFFYLILGWSLVFSILRFHPLSVFVSRFCFLSLIFAFSFFLTSVIVTSHTHTHTMQCNPLSSCSLCAVNSVLAPYKCNPWNEKPCNNTLTHKHWTPMLLLFIRQSPKIIVFILESVYTQRRKSSNFCYGTNTKRFLAFAMISFHLLFASSSFSSFVFILELSLCIRVAKQLDMNKIVA